MKRKITWLFLVATAIIFNTQARAQIGIDENNPDPYSILEMEATDKGVLLPRMTTNERFALKTSCGTNCPDGLLVYDTDKSAFFYFVSNKWFTLNPWVAEDDAQNAAEDMQTHAIVGDVGIGKAPDATYKFDVDGNTYLEGEVDIDDDLTIKTGDVTLEQGDLKLLQGSMEIKGSYKTTQGHFIANTSQANKYSSDVTTANVAGPVPRGGIIMWSGSTGSIPAGWALCDGTNGTPDLKGRFIVGFGTRDSIIRTAAGSTMLGDDIDFQINNKGGTDAVILSEEQLPAHNHSASMSNGGAHTHDIYFGGWDSGGLISARTHLAVDDNSCCSNIGTDTGQPDHVAELGPDDGSHKHTVTIGSTGANKVHENLPPYYVLAFIMKK